jgi:hypothetical protein
VGPLSAVDQLGSELLPDKLGRELLPDKLLSELLDCALNAPFLIITSADGEGSHVK